MGAVIGLIVDYDGRTAHKPPALEQGISSVRSIGVPQVLVVELPQRVGEPSARQPTSRRAANGFAGVVAVVICIIPSLRM